MSEKIPINKGNYDMESPERCQKYEENRGWGWEEEYKEYRDNWIKYPREQYISEYPLEVDIELSTVCNLQCPMCFTTTDEFKSKIPRIFMDMELLKKIIDEIAGKVPAVRLSLRGESTLHPEFINCIRYCKEKGIKEVSFLTNASTLTQAFFTEMAEAGADWITISIDGTGEVYENVRKPLKFKETLQKIKDIFETKKERGWKRPVIKIQSVWPAIRENPSEYYNLFAPYVDLIAYNPLIDYLGKDEEIIYEESFACPQLYQRLIVGADGNVLLCTNDEDGRYVLGNAKHQSIYEIWHGKRREKILKLHEANKFKEIELCRRCYLPRAVEENECAYVNEKKVIIKNYVNRKQTIGD